jgi:hypothetical protein
MQSLRIKHGFQERGRERMQVKEYKVEDIWDEKAGDLIT